MTPEQQTPATSVDDLLFTHPSLDSICWRHHLTVLRQAGAKRLRRSCNPYWAHTQHHLKCCGTPALFHYWDMGCTSMLDIGCGDSPDRLIAASWGQTDVYGLDLFAPRESPRQGVIQANALHIPLADGCIDGILCTAMIDLIAPSDRPALYRELRRVAVKWGLFIIAPFKLRDGHGYDWPAEDRSIVASGWHRINLSGVAKMYGACDGEQCSFCEDVRLDR